MRRRIGLVGSAAAEACAAVGVPPRLAARALLVLLLGVSAPFAPAAVRWATGSDVSAARQLKLAREEITLLGGERSDSL